MSSSVSPASFAVRPQIAADKPAISALQNRVFGPGRYAKASYRLREGVEPIDALSLVAMREGDNTIVGSIRYWPVMIGPNASSQMDAALLLGPLAVAPEVQGKGAGLALMKESLRLAAGMGHRLVLLVGDLPYYARVGFSQVPRGRVVMPQPYDPDRLLWLPLVPGAEEDVAGAMLKAR